jgi:hypothetical protein
MTANAAPAAKPPKKATLPAWKVVWKMIVYRKDLWLGNWLMMILMMLFYQIPGLALREFFNLLTRLRESDGVTIVLTTHYMEEAERCDRIGVLDQGRLVAIAPPGELKQRVGGDVMVISAPAPAALAQKIAQQFQVRAALVDGTLRIERPRGHELVARLVDEFGGEIESITFGRPTLEDVFVHLTGHRFLTGPREEDSR